MADDDRHDDLRELLVPYSLGDLDVATTVRVERALDEDEALRRELEALEDAGAKLVASLPRHAAPESLKLRVMDAVGAASNRGATEEHAARSISDLPRARRERRWRGFALPTASAALAVACTVLALAVVDLRGDLDEAESRLDRGTTSAASAPFERAGAREVKTTDGLATARGSLLAVGDDEYLLVIEDLPRPKPGTSWQVWTADASGGHLRNVAQWTADESVQMLVIDSAHVDQVMISHERATHPVPAPSGAPIATVQV